MASCLAGDKRGDKRVPVGRLKKCEGGWNSANKRIWIGNETFAKWRSLRDKLRLANDDAVACYLLEAVQREIQRPSPRTDHSVNEFRVDQLQCERLISVALMMHWYSLPLFTEIHQLALLMQSNYYFQCHRRLLLLILLCQLTKLVAKSHYLAALMVMKLLVYAMKTGKGDRRQL